MKGEPLQIAGRRMEIRPLSRRQNQFLVYVTEDHERPNYFELAVVHADGNREYHGFHASRDQVAQALGGNLLIKASALQHDADGRQTSAADPGPSECFGVYRRDEDGTHAWIRDYDSLDEARAFALLGHYSCQIA